MKSRKPKKIKLRNPLKSAGPLMEYKPVRQVARRASVTKMERIRDHINWLWLPRATQLRGLRAYIGGLSRPALARIVRDARARA